MGDYCHLKCAKSCCCVVGWTLLRPDSFEICVGGDKNNNNNKNNNNLVCCLKISPSNRLNSRSKFIVWYLNVCLCVYIRDGRGGAEAAESARVNLSELNISPLDEDSCY